MHAARVLASAVLLLTGLTGCELGDDTDDQLDAAVDALVAGLESGDLAGAPVTGEDPTEAYATLTAGFGPEPEVSVEDIEADGDAATATLRWSWDFRARPWTYESSADLTRDGEEWQVVWSPEIVHGTLREGWTLDVDLVSADRGDILGARDSLIVTERDVVRLGLDKTRVKQGQVAASARRIAQLLEIDVAAYVERARSSGPQAFVEAIVLRAGDAEQYVDEAWAAVPGAATIGGQLTAAEADQLRALMRAVVTEGSGSVLSGIADVRAKTGTAEFGEPDAAGELRTHAWMIAGRGDLAVAVFVEQGQSGSATAGPVLRGFLAP